MPENNLLFNSMLELKLPFSHFENEVDLKKAADLFATFIWVGGYGIRKVTSDYWVIIASIAKDLWCSISPARLCDNDIFLVHHHGGSSQMLSPGFKSEHHTGF